MDFGINCVKELRLISTDRLLIDFGILLKKYGLMSILRLKEVNYKKEINLPKI